MECWATNQQLILINKPLDPPFFYSRSWRTTSTPNLAFATHNIHKLCHREDCYQLGRSDHGLVTELVDQKTPVSTLKRAPSWNYKRADWDGFKQFAEEECMGLQLSEENMNHKAVQFNPQSSRKVHSQGTKKKLQPLLEPTARTAAGSCQQSRGRHGKNPL